MKFEKFAVHACCGTTAVALKLGAPLSPAILAFLVGNGYIESPNFTKAGILYVENEGLTVTGALGSDILQLKCKNNDCSKYISDFEELLNMG
jgi:hypothetical protein